MLLSRSKTRTISAAGLHFHDLNPKNSHQIQFQSPKLLNPVDAWFLKVLISLFAHTAWPNAKRLAFLKQSLTPSTTLRLINTMDDPNMSFKFVEFTTEVFGFDHQFHVYSCLLKRLASAGFANQGRRVLMTMRERGFYVGSTNFGFLVSAFAQSFQFEAAIELIADARACNSQVNVVTVNRLLNLLIKRGRIGDAERLFRKSAGTDFTPDTCTHNIIIRGFCKAGKIDAAFAFLREMGTFRCSPDVITYNTLIDCLCRTNDVDRGHHLLKQVQLSSDCVLDVVSYTSVIWGYCKAGRMIDAASVYAEVISSGLRPSIVTYNVLIDGYGKAGDMVSARRIYEQMSNQGCSPDVVSYTALIDGYSRKGLIDEAIGVFDEMYGKGLSPNEYSFSILINGLCKMNRLGEARKLLQEVNRRDDVVAKTFMYNPVIDGFCKAGNVDEANVIVSEMVKKKCAPDERTYTILIIGHCMKGRTQEGFELYNSMLAAGCAPNESAISSLLSRLLKVGMPVEADEIAISFRAKEPDDGSLVADKDSVDRKVLEIPVAL